MKMDRLNELEKLCNCLSDIIYSDKSAWEYLNFDTFVTDCAQEINKYKIWNLTEETSPPKMDYYLTKYLNCVPYVLFYNGKTWGKTGRSDIPNDKVGAPMWWLTLTDDPENM